MLTLYGWNTSPYVRRVRVVADAVGQAVRFVDVSTGAGKAVLQRVTPIEKVPVAEFSDEVIFDSTTICERMIAEHGFGVLRATVAPSWHERNMQHVIDEALDAGIARLYLGRAGIADDARGFMKKQYDRMERCMAWLESEMSTQGWLTSSAGLGLTEVSLFVLLDWMQFRDAYPLQNHPKLHAFHRTHADSPWFAGNGPADPVPV